jgi:two-component system, sensor histidine kinase and response regulator
VGELGTLDRRARSRGARAREIRAQSEALQAANTELSSANDQLAHLNAEKNEFLGIVTHDLKNPLGAGRGYAELLQGEAADLPPAEVSGFAAKIDKAARLSFDLVTNLLDINRIEQGQMQMALQPVDLAAATRHAASTYAERAAAKGQRLDVELEPALPQALADPGPLAQVIDNLVSNAVKYSPAGLPITLRVLTLQGHMRLEVQDRGPGLSPADLSKLFGKFARLSARPTGGEHSTGLGLAIVKRIVESMSGRVWCESVQGQGATFVLELPAA